MLETLYWERTSKSVQTLVRLSTLGNFHDLDDLLLSCRPLMESNQGCGRFRICWPGLMLVTQEPRQVRTILESPPAITEQLQDCSVDPGSGLGTGGPHRHSR